MSSFLFKKNKIIKFFSIFLLLVLFQCKSTKTYTSTIKSVPSKNNFRGLQWVRTHPMFISGLVVAMDNPPKNIVDRYFDDFGANAIHTWQGGLDGQIAGWQSHKPAAPFVSWVKQNGNSQTKDILLGGYPANAPGRIGFQIGDEPATIKDFNEMKSAMEKIREKDPDALLIINFRYHEKDLPLMLDAFKDTQADIISYDRYRYKDEAYEPLAYFRKKGLELEKPYWRYLRSYNNSKKTKPDISESDMRWDAFSGLLYGYTGHTWFVYQSADPHDPVTELFPQKGKWIEDDTLPRNEDAEKLFAIASQINKEMSHLGKAITQLTSTDVRFIRQGIFGLPKYTQGWSPSAGNDPYIQSIQPDKNNSDILVGFFKDNNNEIYIMVQNASHKNAGLVIGSEDSETIIIDFDFSEAPIDFDKNKVISLNRLTGELEDLTLIDTNKGKRLVIKNLEAGNPVLFKYSTGKKFALGQNL